MTEPTPDPRPQPRWGQYADVPPPAPQYPPPSIPEPAPEPERRRTGDIVLTTVLLLVGVYDVVAQWPLYASLGSALQEAYRVQGIGEFTSIGLADSMGVVLNIVRAGLLAVVVAWSLVRIGRRKRAFWVPLAGGVLAGIVAIGFLFAIILQDPAFLEYAQRTAGG
ncbi:DUF6264 family protein [Salinibacterium soli]